MTPINLLLSCIIILYLFLRYLKKKSVEFVGRWLNEKIAKQFKRLNRIQNVKCVEFSTGCERAIVKIDDPLNLFWVSLHVLYMCLTPNALVIFKFFADCLLLSVQNVCWFTECLKCTQQWMISGLTLRKSLLCTYTLYTLSQLPRTHKQANAKSILEQMKVFVSLFLLWHVV